MTKKKALRLSIQHWMENVVKAENDEAFSVMYTDCACCSLFYRKDCIGCPIKEATGERSCQDSPYDEAEEECQEAGGENGDGYRFAPNKYQKEYVWDELIFLQNVWYMLGYKGDPTE